MQSREARQETGLRAAAPRGVDDMIEADAERRRLGGDFRRASDVTKTAEPMIRAAAGNDVGLSSPSAQIFAKFVKRPLIVDRPPGRIDVKLGAHQAAQQDVADLTIGG